MNYNKYIDRIGIEFEGYWTSDNFPVIIEQFPFLSDHHFDGSLVTKYASFTPRELITEPLRKNEIDEVFRYVKILRDKKQYMIDDTVGLHFHISFADKIYGALCSEKFYKYYLDKFALWFPNIWAIRKDNHYCRASLQNYDEGEEGITKKEHFKRQSGFRYHFINYQIAEHKTIEVRGYGGKDATVEGLEECIQKTIDCIPRFIQIYKGSEQVIRIQADENPTHKKEKKEVAPSFSSHYNYNFYYTEALRNASWPTSNPF